MIRFGPHPVGAHVSVDLGPHGHQGVPQRFDEGDQKQRDESHTDDTRAAVVASHPPHGEDALQQPSPGRASIENCGFAAAVAMSGHLACEESSSL